MIDLDLNDPIDVVFHRIFGRDQFVVDLIQLRQGRVEGRGFSRSGRTGHQNDPVGSLHDDPEVTHGFFVHPNFGEGQIDHRPIQDPHNNALAEHGWQDADAKVDRVTTDHQLNPSVLRQSPFGDIEVCHNLDPRRDRERQVSGRGNHLIEDPFGLDPNPELVLKRFKVNVARVVLDRQK